MALFKISRGNAADLWTSNASKAAKNGYAWFTQDDGRFYIDVKDATTAVLNDSRIPVSAYHALKTIINSKVYTNVYAASDADPAAWFYFARIHRSNYYDVWHVKYRLYMTIANTNDGNGFYEVDIYGSKNTYYAFRCYNAIANTDTYPLYSHAFIPSTELGVNRDLGGLLGFRLQSAWKPATEANARTVLVEIIETDNCDIELLNAVQLFANLNVTDSYGTRVELNGRTQGQTTTGDRNDNTINTLQSCSGTITTIASEDGGIGSHRYSLHMMDVNGNFTSIAATTGSVSNDNGTSTSKTAATASLLIYSPIYYKTTNGYIAPNASGSMTGYSACAFDFRYSSKCEKNLIAGKPVYLIGTPNSDNTFIIDATTWYTQTLPVEADGKIYIYLGLAYSTYQVYLAPSHSVFEYKDNQVRPFVRKNVLSVTDGGTGLNASPSLLVNLADTTAADIFTASPRPGVTGVLPIAQGGTGVTSSRAAGLPQSWIAKVQGQIWSRLCYVPYSNNYSGSSFFLSIRGYRSGMIYNYTFLITPHHSKKAQINVIGGSEYSDVAIRTIGASNGNCYVELLDTAKSIAEGTVQNVACTLFILSKGAVEPTLYTEFTDGTVLPEGAVVATTLTCQAYAGFQTSGRYIGNGAGLTDIPASSITGILAVANGGTGNNTGTALFAEELVNKTLDGTTLDNTAGSFAFQGGNDDPWTNRDWVGLQIGNDVDKFQIVTAVNNVLYYRQNDNGGTNTTWKAWRMFAHGPSSTAVGSEYKPVYMQDTGALTAVTDNSTLVDLASATPASVFAASPNIGVKNILGTANGGTNNNTWTGGYLVYSQSASKLSNTNYMHVNYRAGSEVVDGYEELVIGNKTASGSTNNAYGQLALYSTSTAGGYIRSAPTSSWKTHYLPVANGWLVTAGNGTDTGAGSQYKPIYVSTTGIATACDGPSLLVNLESTAAADIFVASPRPGITGTLPATNGGTGKTTLKDAANALINALDTGSSNLTANDYVITQFVTGGTTTTTYHRRAASKVVNATLVKAALGATSTVSTQSQTTKFLREDGTWAAPSYTEDTNDKVSQLAPIATDAKYPVILGYNNVNTATLYTNTVNRTGVNIYVNPSTNTLSANRLAYNNAGAEKAYSVYNDTDQSIDFIFV